MTKFDEEGEVKIEQNIIHSIVYEHLIHNCYSETALLFGNACKLSNNNKVDEHGDMEMTDTLDAKFSSTAAGLESMENRKVIYQLIVKSNINEAVKFCHLAFPNALNGVTPESMDICFQIKCQQFIECVKKDGSIEAFNYAQSELAQYAEIDEYRDALQDTIGILAYQDPYKSPLASQLSQARLEDLANSLNKYILAFEQVPSTTAFESIVKHLIVLRETCHAEAVKGSKTKENSEDYKWSMAAFLGESNSS